MTNEKRVSVLSVIWITNNVCSHDGRKTGECIYCHNQVIISLMHATLNSNYLNLYDKKNRCVMVIAQFVMGIEPIQTYFRFKHIQIHKYKIGTSGYTNVKLLSTSK